MVIDEPDLKRTCAKEFWFDTRNRKWNLLFINLNLKRFNNGKSIDKNKRHLRVGTVPKQKSVRL